MTTEKPVVVWQRQRYRLTPHRDGWRLRSRARGDEFDWQFPACSLATARKLALAKFEDSREVRAPRTAATLQDVVDAYNEMPKKAGTEAAYNNVCRLKTVVRLVHGGKDLKRVLVSEAGPRLWNAYMAARQGGKLDLSIRRPEHTSINAAVRGAASLFIPRLRPSYAERGIEIPADATVIQWLQEVKIPKPKADDKGMLKEWRKLKGPTYWTVGLARFAGLRQKEIAACQRDWIIEDKGAMYVEMRDRPDQHWYSKTGEMYRALVIDVKFAKELLKLKKGHIVKTPDGINRGYWFEHEPQKWLRPFTGTARMPLHRLRGLYADDVKRITEDAVAAHLAGVKAASKNLGHTNTQTTQNNYLSEGASGRR